MGSLTGKMFCLNSKSKMKNISSLRDVDRQFGYRDISYLAKLLPVFLSFWCKRTSLNFILSRLNCQIGGASHIKSGMSHHCRRSYRRQCRKILYFLDFWVNCHCHFHEWGFEFFRCSENHMKVVHHFSLSRDGAYHLELSKEDFQDCQVINLLILSFLPGQPFDLTKLDILSEDWQKGKYWSFLWGRCTSRGGNNSFAVLVHSCNQAKPPPVSFRFYP